ncbi:Olfactory receptor 2K2, partial [Ophiophagus hannah]
TLTNYIVLLIFILAFGFSSFLFTLASYINIISSILKIKSSAGRQKAFSTCSSHLIVVGLFYMTAFVHYMKPSSESLMDLDKVISIQYSILTPMLNPIIYSLKNEQILSETLTNYIVLLIFGLAFRFSSFVFTLASYINIISSILKIKSSAGRQKAFSTCSSLLIVVGLFYMTAFVRYMKPSSESLMDLDKVISIQYSILTPMLNPIIYNLKNEQILSGVKKNSLE